MKKMMTIFAAALVAAAFAIPMSTALPGMGVANAQMVDGPKIKWRMSLWGKRRAFTEAPEYVSAQVAKRTEGKFTLQLYYGQQLSKSKENLDGISVGAFESASFCAAYHPKKNAPLNVLDLPFLPLKDFDTMRRVHDAVYAHPASQAALGKWNAVIYMSMLLPQYEYMGRGKAPRTVADFKGMRLRALGGMGRAAEAIGAVPTTVPAPEVYNAISRGTVDAVGFPFTYTFRAYKVDEVAEWYTTNMKLGTVNCPIVFNKAAWAKLPEQYKQLLLELKDGAYKALETAYAEKDKVNLAEWPKKMTPIVIPENEMARFRDVAGKPLWDKWVTENKGELPAQELLDLVLKTAGS